MAHLLRGPATARPGEIALADEHGAWDWTGLDRRTNRWIAMLRAAGLEGGDRVAVSAGNRRETYEILLACLHAGFVVVPVNWHLTAPEIAHVLADSHSRALVVDGDRAGAGGAAVRALPDPPPVRLVLGGADRPGFAAAEPRLADSTGTEPDGQRAGGLMLYTSGTTGAPKGVVSHLFPIGSGLDRIHGRVRAIGDDLRLPDRAPVLLAGVWYHSAPLFFSLLPLLRGARLVLRHGLDAAGTLDLIDAERIAMTHLVPTQFVRLLRLPPMRRRAFRGTSLRQVWHGGGPCAVDVKRAMLRWWGPVLVEYYAATEAGIVTVIDSAEWARKPGSVGRAVASSQLLVLGADGRPLPAGHHGRVYVRRRGGGFRYHNADEKTRQAHLDEHTFTYGDLGHVDEDGYLFLSGRDGDAIISGGVNVYPAEVEAALLGHPAVVDAVVFGVPDDEYGERVAALVELARDGPAGASGRRDLAAALDAHCRTRLAGFKVPRSYSFTTTLPRDGNGKVRAASLRDRSRRSG